MGLAIAAGPALLVAGCGGGGTTSSFTGPDPATLTPADTPLFAEAVVRPEGDQKEAVEAALSKLLATDDPGEFIIQRLDDAWLRLMISGRATTTSKTSRSISQ